MQTLQFKLTLLKQDEKATSRQTTHDKSFIVNSIVTRNWYSTTSRVGAPLWMKQQLKMKLKSFGKVFGKV